MRANLLSTTASICAVLLVACSNDRADEGRPGNGGDDGESTCASFVKLLVDCGVITGTRLGGCEDDHPLLSCVIDCVENASCEDIEAAYCNLEPNTFVECVTGCESAQPIPEFVCDNGAPIQASWRCDGVSDCPNGEDEACPDGMFTCDSGLSIPAGWQCDGVSDCEAGEDELDCVPGSSVACRDGTSIPASRQCNGVPDCANDEDELDCTKLSCG
jgi:hypothetical protein